MKKELLVMSVVLSTAMLSGCGGGGGSSDTTKPKFNNSKYEFYNIKELTSKTIELKANEEIKQFSENSDLATISGSNLIFNAPAYRVGESNKYVVTVTAEDLASNFTDQNFTFTVVENNTGTYEANSSIIVPVGDKEFKPEGSYLVGPTGLLWADEITDVMSYDEAERYCSEKGFRVPSRSELLNTIDYTLDGSSDVSLLDNNFVISRAGTGDNKVETSWAHKEGDNYYEVNNFSGADVKASVTEEHRVRCVKGTPAVKHTFSRSGNYIVDDQTKLTWTVIDIDPSDGNRTYETYDNAQGFCPNGFELPTINMLRGIFDYDSNQLPLDIAPDGSNLPADTYNIWSNTKFTNKVGTEAYFTILNNQNTSIRSDEHNQTAYVTCVKQ